MKFLFSLERFLELGASSAFAQEAGALLCRLIGSTPTSRQSVMRTWHAAQRMSTPTATEFIVLVCEAESAALRRAVLLARTWGLSNAQAWRAWAFAQTGDVAEMRVSSGFPMNEACPVKAPVRNAFQLRQANLLNWFNGVLAMSASGDLGAAE